MLQEHMLERIKHSKYRKAAGILLIILGVVAAVAPIVPGAWLVVIGLELLGIRLLVTGKIREQLKQGKKFFFGKSGAANATDEDRAH